MVKTNKTKWDLVEQKPCSNRVHPDLVTLFVWVDTNLIPVKLLPHTEKQQLVSLTTNYVTNGKFFSASFTGNWKKATSKIPNILSSLFFCASVLDSVDKETENLKVFCRKTFRNFWIQRNVAIDLTHLETREEKQNRVPGLTWSWKTQTTFTTVKEIEKRNKRRRRPYLIYNTNHFLRPSHRDPRWNQK